MKEFGILGLRFGVYGSPWDVFGWSLGFPEVASGLCFQFWVQGFKAPEGTLSRLIKVFLCSEFGLGLRMQVSL